MGKTRQMLIGAGLIVAAVAGAGAVNLMLREPPPSGVAEPIAASDEAGDPFAIYAEPPAGVRDEAVAVEAPRDPTGR